MLFATTLRVHSEYGNIALHYLWFGRSILLHGSIPNIEHSFAQPRIGVRTGRIDHLPLLCCLITSKCVVDFGWLGKSSQYCWA